MEKIKLLEGSYPDFVTCIGNTSKDEDMFNELIQMSKLNKQLDVRKFRG